MVSYEKRFIYEILIFLIVLLKFLVYLRNVIVITDTLWKVGGIFCPRKIHRVDEYSIFITSQENVQAWKKPFWTYNEQYLSLHLFGNKKTIIDDIQH